MAHITVSEERGVRFLHFGSPWVQGAMRIARPWALELEYTRELMLPLLLRDDARWPRTVLQVGLGAGSVTKFLYRHRPEARLAVVEIDPAVVSVARLHFKLPDDAGRIRIDVGEGRDYMAGGVSRFDFVVVDGFDERGHAGPLDSLPFYLDVKRRLARDGLLAVNLLTRRKSAAASVERLAEAFDGRVVELPPSEAGNVVALAAVGREIAMTVEALRDAAEELKRDTGLDLRPTVARLAERGGRLIL